MNVETRSPLSRISPRAMAVLLSLALIAVHLILLLGSLIRTHAAVRTGEQIEAMRANVGEMDEGERQRINQLEGQLMELTASQQVLLATLPEDQDSFPLYRQSYSLANLNRLRLEAVNRTGEEPRTTAVGQVETIGYYLRMEGDLRTCLQYVAEFETRGGPGVAIDRLLADDVVGSCSFAVSTVNLSRTR